MYIGEVNLFFSTCLYYDFSTLWRSTPKHHDSKISFNQNYIIEVTLRKLIHLY